MATILLVEDTGEPRAGEQASAQHEVLAAETADGLDARPHRLPDLVLGWIWGSRTRMAGLRSSAGEIRAAPRRELAIVALHGRMPWWATRTSEAGFDDYLTSRSTSQPSSRSDGGPAASEPQRPLILAVDDERRT